MRKLIVLVVLLAAAKLGYQEYLFRASTRDIIVSTFQERAVQSCQRQARDLAAVSPTAWTQPSAVGLVIGRPGLDVWFWQVGSSRWNARYRDPHLRIVAGDGAGRMVCSYDILQGSASVQRS